jgi:hypothetical protein
MPFWFKHLLAIYTMSLFALFQFTYTEIEYYFLYCCINTSDDISIYEGTSLNNRNLLITLLQEYLEKVFVSYFST